MTTGYAAGRQQAVDGLAEQYSAWHWGAPARKVIRVNDPLVPNVVGIGHLLNFTTDNGVLDFPTGCWLAFDPKHEAERLHVVTTKAFREKIRNRIKHTDTSHTIQQLAEMTEGDHAEYPLPNIRGAPIGWLGAVVYRTFKEGEEGHEPGDERPDDYEHEFGKEHSGGIVPILAADVSGRIWVCGGSYRCPLAGITG